jgi:hypothetical protein
LSTPYPSGHSAILRILRSNSNFSFFEKEILRGRWNLVPGQFGDKFPLMHGFG